MKKIILILFSLGLFLSCSEESLKLENPNEPGLQALKTEVGIQKAALGVYHPMRWEYFIWFTQCDHNAMGDATTASPGNFGFRWMNQVASIKLSDGKTLTPPQGGTQAEELNKRNSRDFGYDNVFIHEWIPLYGVIGHSNLMLSQIEEVAFKGTEQEKKVKMDTYKAWFLWWKGFAYSRIGSIYEKAIIAKGYNEINNQYSSNTEIIAEAKRNFEEAKALLKGIAEDDATYKELMTSFIPSSFRSGHGGFISPDMFERNINTYLARNILVNKYAKDLTDTELTEIETLAKNGIKKNDKIFNVRSDTEQDNCFVWQTTWSAARIFYGWENVSERLIQDFKAGDDRYKRNVIKRISHNPRGRGFAYGTRYTMKNNGDYVSTTPGFAEIPLACSYEENQLMLAEVKIRKGNIDDGLAYVDAVRNYQNAKLAAVAATGLNKETALEELRKERRIGLFLKGTSFYDARRWGVLKPLAEGGGRKNAVVVISTAGDVDENATIDYSYLEWWPVPANETDFNPIKLPVTSK